LAFRGLNKVPLSSNLWRLNLNFLGDDETDRNLNFSFQKIGIYQRTHSLKVKGWVLGIISSMNRSMALKILDMTYLLFTMF
jgi:hypothetical protein